MQRRGRRGMGWNGLEWEADFALVVEGSGTSRSRIERALLLILEISGDGARNVWVMPNGNPSCLHFPIVCITLDHAVQRHLASLYLPSSTPRSLLPFHCHSLAPSLFPLPLNVCNPVVVPPKPKHRGSTPVYCIPSMSPMLGLRD